MSATIEEVRSLTDYGRDTISGEKMVSLHSRAKKELESDLGQSVDFSTDDADTALFWLLCLFSKIHVGEIAASSFTVGDLEDEPLDTESNFWLEKYHQRRDELLRDRTTGVGHIKTGRTDRQYGYEDS